MIPRSVLLSRRFLLQHAAGAASTVTIIGACRTATAAPKISKQAVAYQDHPEGNKRCDKCVQFQPPNACKLVEGAISPQGSCRIFVLARQ